MARKNKSVIVFHLLVNVFTVLFITGASYIHIPLEGGKDTLIYLGHLFLLQTTVAGFIYLLSLSRWIFRIIFSVLFVVLCTFSFWAYTQDINVTSGLVQAVFETKPDIVVDVITWPYALFVFMAVLAVVFIQIRYNKIRPRKRMLLFVPSALACIAFFFITETKRMNTLKSKLPYAVFFGIKDYYEKPELKLNSAISEVTKTEDSLKVVFVLGETVRADHLSLNGYPRNTTPLLIEENVISFSKLHTDYTYTAASIPQILTDQNLSDTRQQFTSVFSVVNRANINTTWIGNQTLEKSFEPIVQTNDEVVLVDAFKSEYSFNKSLDETMLPILGETLSKSTNQLITLHTIGSHWYYENRYDKRHKTYEPVIDSKYIPSVTKEEMINSYDNTILYLDYFLDQVIEQLKKETVSTALVYISDHGEFLGENGKYLHASSGDELKNPAYLFWFSEIYKTEYPDLVSAISEAKDSPITTDSFFYSVLEILRIESTQFPKN